MDATIREPWTPAMTPYEKLIASTDREVLDSPTEMRALSMLLCLDYLPCGHPTIGSAIAVVVPNLSHRQELADWYNRLAHTCLA